MKNFTVWLCLLIICVPVLAEERIEIQSSLISTSTTSLVVGGKITSSKAKVTLRLSVDSGATGINGALDFTVDSLQPTWVVSTALSGSTSPTAYTAGTHTVLISMVEFGTSTPILATASAVMTVETARSHIWLDKVSATNGNFFRKDNTETDYFLFNTDQIIAPNAALEPVIAPPNVKQLTVTLIQSLDLANERLDTTLPTSASYSIIGNGPTSKQIKITATGTLAGATVSG